jgi:hypothetical protein
LRAPPAKLHQDPPFPTTPYLPTVLASRSKTKPQHTACGLLLLESALARASVHPAPRSRTAVAQYFVVQLSIFMIYTRQMA